jgi:transcriptional regulator with XRE-family HTH domain
MKYNQVSDGVRQTDRMQSPDDVATAVGRNVRALRQQRRMTIDALATAAGVSRGTVIQIETARGNPSIATLTALAAALRVGVASLIEDSAAPRVVVRRADEAAALWRSEVGSTAVFRIGTDPPDVVELWDWTLQPGDAFDGEAHPMGTQEVLSVLSGRLGLRVGDTEQHLETGDTVLFQAHAPHRYSGAGDGPVRFVMVVLQPGDAGLVPPTAIAEAEIPLS